MRYPAGAKHPGCNLEDSDYERGGLVDVQAQCDLLAEVAAAAAAAAGAGVPLVLNARVDVFARARSEDQASPAVIDEAISRGRRYLAAGADCVYPITATGDDVIARLAGGLDGRVNILYRPGAPSLTRPARPRRPGRGGRADRAVCSARNGRS